MGPRSKTTLRSIMRHFCEGLMWMGQALGTAYFPVMPDDTHSANPDLLPMPPLSDQEWAEWAALIERLR